MDIQYVPVTPGGTPCDWLSSDTEAEAIGKLLKDAAHMPYKTWENFQKRAIPLRNMNLKMSNDEDRFELEVQRELIN